MPNSTKAISNFTSGEFDPRLYGRTDIDQYQNGAKELTNVIVEWYGGATRTPGTYFINEVKTSSTATRLIPFVFSDTQAYIIEVGNLYFRYYREHGQIVSGATAVETTTTYTAAQVFDIKYAQTADVMYLVHGSHALAKLVRTAHTTWTLSDVTLKWGPFRNINTTVTTMNPSATTGVGIDLVSSTDFFDADHVGAQFRMHSGYMTITAVTDAKNAVATVNDDLTASTATTDWYEGAFSTYRGFPTVIAFYEDRLVLGATDTDPNSVWLSKPGEYDNFDIDTAAAGDGIADTVNARRLNRIKWIEPGDFLALGNEGGIVRYWSGTQSDPLTPTSKNAKTILSEGCNKVLPVTVGSTVHYIGNDGLTVHALAYSLSDDKHYAGDVTLLSRSLIDSTIVDMAYQQHPHSIIWYVTTDGGLVSSTINIQQKIIAFTQQDDTLGDYKSVASIPVTGYDEVYFIVEREIDGSTVQYIEYMKKYNETTQDDLFYVRSGLTYDSTSTTTITGLSHLEGETVAICADGYAQPDKVVSGGSITIDRAASTVHVGLAYTSVIETLDINAGSAIGSAIPKHRRINKVAVELYNSMGCKVGRTGNMQTIPFDLPASLFTGRRQVSFPVGWKEDMTVRITQDKPLPLTVNAIYPDMLTND